MEEIVITEDDLRRLEKRFGSAVRLMGPWNSDGTFAYTSVPLVVVRKAAEELAKTAVLMDLSSLNHMTERTTAFLGLLQTFGSPLVAAIVTAYREYPPGRVAAVSSPAESARGLELRSLIRTAAA